MSSAEMSCCYCQATFPPPPGKPGSTFKCPKCGARLARASQAPSAARGWRGLIRLALLVVALPALVFAGFKIYATFSEEFTKPALPPGPGAPIRPGLQTESIPGTSDDGAVRSHVSVYPKGNSAEARATVALGLPFSTQPIGTSMNPRAGILQRELVRQAFLIAARDELGLATRDEVLGERQPGAGTANSGPEVHTISGVDGMIRVVIRPGEADGAEPLFDRDLTKTPEGTEKTASGDPAPEDLANLTERAEELSRTELPGVLRKLGLDGKPNVTKAGGQVPEAIENRLSCLGFTEVFAAVKALHALIRSDGESPARVGAVVRGYALLGILSEFQWHPAHKAYKARALLYAQRLVARQSKDPSALWHRAFAQALVGLHANAIADLAAAEAVGKPARPTWVDPISALVRCDAKALEAKAGANSKLASLLRLTLLEFPATPNITLPAASDVLKLEPDCYRAIDTMCVIRAVSTLHVVTLLGPQTLEQTLPKKLKAIESLPRPVQAFLEKPEGGSFELAGLLEQADGPHDDAGELSWSALGHLIRETQFVQVYRRLYFLKFIWSVPVDDFWDQSPGWVEGHPLRSFLETFVASPKPAASAAIAEIERFSPINLEPTSSELFKVLFKVTGGATVNYPRVIASHGDHVVRDISLQIRNADDSSGAVDYARSGRMLLALSPHSQYARANLIEHDWEHAKSHVTEWEKESSGSPTLLGAIARRYQAMGKTDDAERLLAEYTKLRPTTGPTRCWRISTRKKGTPRAGWRSSSVFSRKAATRVSTRRWFASVSRTTISRRSSGKRPRPMRKRPRRPGRPGR